MRKTKRAWIFLIGAVLLVIDQLTKVLVRMNLIDGKEIPVAGLFTLTFVQNTGAVFGSFKGLNGVFIWVTIMAIGLMLHFWDSFPKDRLSRLCLVFMMVGSLGNLIDRIFLGYVTDFMDFGFFPVFNVADSLVSIGVVGIVAALAKETLAEKKKERKAR